MVVFEGIEVGDDVEFVPPKDYHLLVMVSTGKGTWGQVHGLMTRGNWLSITIVATEWSRENFPAPEDAEWVMYKPYRKGFHGLRNEMMGQLNQNYRYAVNIFSGRGKEHMCLIAALNELNADYKYTVLCKEGPIFFNH